MRSRFHSQRSRTHTIDHTLAYDGTGRVFVLCPDYYCWGLIDIAKSCEHFANDGATSRETDIAAQKCMSGSRAYSSIARLRADRHVELWIMGQIALPEEYFRNSYLFLQIFFGLTCTTQHLGQCVCILFM